MSYLDHIEEWPTCASLGHAIFNCQIVYCPHTRDYTLSCTLGDETDVAWTHRTARYGPFDDITDVAADIAQWLKVLARRTLLEAALSQRALERRTVPTWDEQPQKDLNELP